MSNALQARVATSAIEATLIQGDLSALTSEQRLAYYNSVCQSLGLNSLTKPFEYIKLNSRLVLYAKRDATDQLRSLKQISVKIVSREQIGDVYVVTAQATDPSGRTDESIGAVTVGKLTGDAMANALMKCETKAKRRVTLSICGLGVLDETELETIPPEAIEPARSGQESPPARLNLSSSKDPADYVVNFGKKLMGKRLGDIDTAELIGMMDWLNNEAKKPLTTAAKEFLQKAEAYIEAQIGQESEDGQQ